LIGEPLRHREELVWPLRAIVTSRKPIGNFA
jgi:hypothetical protein